MTRAASHAVNIPVIASGGAGTLGHLYDGIVEGNVYAVLIASITHFEDCRITRMNEYIPGCGIPVNL